VNKEHKVCGWMDGGRSRRVIVDIVDRVVFFRSCFFNTDPNPAKFDFWVEPLRDYEFNIEILSATGLLGPKQR